MIKQLITGPNIKHDALNQEPIIIKVIDFTEKSGSHFADEFQKAINSKQSIIPIHIDSYGGQVYTLFGMLELIRTSPVPVATYVSTKAMSCGSVLLSAGTPGYRYLAPNATVLVHQVSAGASGKIEDLEVSTAHTTDLNKRLMGILSKNSGHDAGYFSRMLLENGNADLYYNAKKSAFHGLIDYIKTPIFTIEITQKITLS